MKIFLTLLASFFLLSCQADAQDKFLDIQEIKTPEGINVWLSEDHTLPIIALKFIFLESGTALDPQDKQGLVRLLSNTMDEGAGELDSQSFQKALSDHSISLRFSASRDGFGGNLKTLSRNKGKAFELLRLALGTPRFDAEPVERMRQANMTRIRSSLGEPEWIGARILNDRAFEGHPYAMNSGGTLTSLPKITSEDLRRFQKTFLTKDRLLISVAGDISAKQLSSTLDSIFSTLPEKAPEKTIPDFTLKNAGPPALYQKDVPQTIINMMLPAFGREDPDYYALKIMNYIFGGAGFGSRLMEEAREKKGLTYGIYSGIANYRHLDSLSISTSTKNGSVKEMLSIISNEMEKMQNLPVSDTELKNAKSYLTGSLPLSLSSTDKIAAMMLSLQIEDLPSNYLDHYAAKINAVSAADIQRAAKRVLKAGSITSVLVGQPEDVEPVTIITGIPNAE